MAKVELPLSSSFSLFPSSTFFSAVFAADKTIVESKTLKVISCLQSRPT